ncbi:hypothetical protein [Neobacillus rhizosphaerae]|nr:hypothetical protein [Neobacillus rhizosphaerae]
MNLDDSTRANNILAYYYAKRCLSVSIDNQIEPFYFIYAYEALSRANALLGRHDLSKGQVEQANEFAHKVKDKKSKEMLIKDLQMIDFL